MEDFIFIGCPYCSKVMKVKNFAGIEKAVVNCSACHQKTPFNTWKRINYNDDKTLYGTQEKRTDDVTIPGLNLNLTIGTLIALNGEKETYKLRMGRNVIGRKANASSADIQIPTGESRRMSREHIVIEVKKVEGRGLVHYISLYKEKLNPTFVGDEKLGYGDCLILNQGDKIKLPDCMLVFEIPDEEGTEINN